MTSPSFQLPDEIQGCHALIEQLRVELHAATERIAKLQSEVDESRDAAAHIGRLEDLLAQYQETIADQEQTIRNLSADNALLKRSLFGSRRERFIDDPSQQLLFDPAELDLPDETTMMAAAQRAVPLIQSFAGPSLWAYLTVSRFADHLPYYRLEDILGRSGFRIDRSTQWRWMRGLAHGVMPLVDLMWERARQSAVLGMDETPVMELGGPGRTLKGYLWAAVGDARNPYDCFFYTSDRRSIRAETLLTGFQGYLTADAYIAYERIGELWPSIIKTSCWVHARRKFEACHHLGATARTHKAMAYFGQLFDIEDLYRQSSDEERIDPFAYLQDVYVRLPKMSLDELPQLLPDQWIKDHPQHLIQQRVQEALDRAQRARERRAERRRAA